MATLLYVHLKKYVVCSLHFIPGLQSAACVLHQPVFGLTADMHTLQGEQDGFSDIDKLRAELLNVLKNIHKEKEEEPLKVVIWCHLGHAYITEVGEGERSMQKFQSTDFILGIGFRISDAMTKFRQVTTTL